MAETDSLEIKIKAEAEKAEEALDRLAQKLEIIVSKLGSTERKTKDIGGVKQASKESKSALDDLSNNAKKAMKNVENATKKAEESLQKTLEKMRKDAESVEVAVDFSRPEVETKKWKSSLIRAKNELSAIVASGDALSQAKGLKRWTVQIAQAEKALRLLNEAEEKRKESNSKKEENVSPEEIKSRTLENLKKETKIKSEMQKLKSIVDSYQKEMETAMESGITDTGKYADKIKEAENEISILRKEMEQVREEEKAINALSEKYSNQSDNGLTPISYYYDRLKEYKNLFKKFSSWNSSKSDFQKTMEDLGKEYGNTDYGVELLKEFEKLNSDTYKKFEKEYHDWAEKQYEIIKNSKIESAKLMAEKGLREPGYEKVQADYLSDKVTGVKKYEEYRERIESILNDIRENSKGVSKDVIDAFEKMSSIASGGIYDLPKLSLDNLKPGESYTEEYKRIVQEMNALDLTIEKLREKRDIFDEAGVSKETEKYKILTVQIGKATEKWDELSNKAHEMRENGDAIEQAEKPVSGFSEKLLNASNVAKTLAGVLRGLGFGQFAARVQSAGQNLANVANGMTEVATTSESAGTAMAGLQTAIPVIGLVLSGITMLINGLRKVGNMISTMVRNVVNFFKKIADSLTGLIKKFLNFEKSGTQTSNKLIRGIQRIFMALASRLRSMAVTAVTDSMGDSFENLQKHSSRLDAQMTKLKVTLQLIGGQFVAAFEPVLNYVLPAVNALANGILSAVNALSQLIAALSGQSTYIKATANMDAFKDSASGASKAQKDLNKQLQSFDELNNITTNDGSKGGSGSGNKDNKGTNYEDADIPENIKKLSEKIKEAWESADFTGIGRTIGENLASALDSIDWSEIQEKARKIGKSLGTLITGFVETPDLANKIGNTIAQAVNTVSYGIGEFLENTNFESVGKFVGESIKSALDGINWSVVISNGKSLGKSLADFLNGLFDANTFASVTKTVANLLNTAFAFLNGFGDTFDFEGFANSIVIGIHNGLNTLDVDSFKDGAEKVAKGFGKAINKLFSDKATWARVIGTGADLINGLVGAINDFLSEIDWSSVSATIFNSITTFIAEVDWKSIGKTFADLLWGAIVTFKSTVENPLTWSELSYALANAIIGMINGLGEDIKKVWTDFWNNLFGEDNDIKDNKNKIKIDVDKPDIKSKIIGAWGEASSWIKTNVKVNPNVNVPDIKSRIVTAWGKAKEYIQKTIKFTPVVNIPDIANRLWHGWKTAKEWWAKNVNFTPKISLERGDDTIANKLWLAWEAAKSWWRRNVSVLTPNIGVPDILGRIRQAWNNAMGWIQQNLILRFHVEFSTPANIIQRAVVRAFGLSGWPTLRFYKNGGFPDMGDLFVANEAGPELVGTVNGKSAVASNNEITGIRDAIYDSSRQELAMLRRQNDLLMQIVQKEFGITDSDIFDSVRRSNRQYYNRTGNNALLI
nr:MAG TPA: minor tail protein [Caudoviricetes sp.]